MGLAYHHQTMMTPEIWKPVGSAPTPYVTGRDLSTFSDDVFSHLLLINIVDDSYLHSWGDLSSDDEDTKKMETSGWTLDSICHKKGSFYLALVMMFFLIFFWKILLMILTYIHGVTYHQMMRTVKRWKPVDGHWIAYVTKRVLSSC